MKIFQVKGFCLSFFVFFVGIFTSCEGTQDQNRRITAQEVKDDKSLKAFVRAAREHLETNYEQAVVDFGKEKRWKSDTVYLWSLKEDGSFLFHIQVPLLKGRKFEDSETTCLVAGEAEMIYKVEKTKEELWDKYYTQAPAQRRQLVERYKIVKRA